MTPNHMADTPDDLREQSIRKIAKSEGASLQNNIVFLLRRLDTARTERDLEAKKRRLAERVIVVSAEERNALQARLDAAMRVVEVAQRLTKRGPLHGGACGTWQRLEQEVAAFDVICLRQEPQS